MGADVGIVGSMGKMKGEAYALDQMPARTLNKRQSKLAKKGDGTS
ncbi:MAG TPA: hypothetical protein VMY43_07705 [Methanothrix sp.]|nr:hypothetical protein [Methanothrix sp.]